MRAGILPGARLVRACPVPTGGGNSRGLDHGDSDGHLGCNFLSAPFASSFEHATRVRREVQRIRHGIGGALVAAALAQRLLASDGRLGLPPRDPRAQRTKSSDRRWLDHATSIHSVFNREMAYNARFHIAAGHVVVVAWPVGEEQR